MVVVGFDRGVMENVVVDRGVSQTQISPCPVNAFVSRFSLTGQRLER